MQMTNTSNHTKSQAGQCKGSGRRVIAKTMDNPLGFCLECRQRMTVSDLQGRWVPRTGLPAVPKIEGTLPKHDKKETA